MVGGIALPGECPFCEYEPASEIIAETKNFYLVPSVGQITEGYLLLCSKKHILGMADLDKEKFVELADFMHKTREAINKVYGPTVVWEHGSTVCAKEIGGCLNHAHFNIFPINKKLIKSVSKEFDIKSLNSIEEIRHANGSYIFLLDGDGKKYLLTNDGATPSQYFRKLVSHRLGVDDKWDWRVYVGEDEFLASIKKLRPLLS